MRGLNFASNCQCLAVCVRVLSWYSTAPLVIVQRAITLNNSFSLLLWHSVELWPYHGKSPARSGPQIDAIGDMVAWIGSSINERDGFPFDIANVEWTFPGPWLGSLLTNTLAIAFLHGRKNVTIAGFNYANSAMFSHTATMGPADSGYIDFRTVFVYPYNT